eukprot:3248579-Amphidinium_carterae.1
MPCFQSIGGCSSSGWSSLQMLASQVKCEQACSQRSAVRVQYKVPATVLLCCLVTRGINKDVGHQGGIATACSFSQINLAQEDP